MNYYVTNIIELEYYRGYKIVLFHCDWVDNRLYRGLKKDKYGFPLVNFSRPLVHTGENLKDDPFIISTQARQVFYIEDLKDVGWSHVIRTKPRDIYDMGTNVNRDDDDSYTQCMPCNLPIMDDVNQEPCWLRINSLLNDDQDLRDEYELNLLSEVEIIDGDGNILRIQKMSVKEVYKLNEGEKVLVHVNAEYQLIGNAGGLCSRFMTLLLKEPNLCPPDAKDWKECKERCGVMLIVELRRRFNIPQSDNVDKVLCAMYRVKRRTLKYRLKMSLYKQAANKLNEVNGLNELGAQEINYSEDDLLEALDLLEPPENFRDHQWQVYKSHLRKPIAKKQSACGKKARHDQMHSHTTGAVSFARRNHEFKVNNKRSPNDVERFQICYKTADDTYIQEATTEMMAQANREILTKKLELGGPEGNVEHDVVAEIARNVLNTLLGDENPRCFGAGVTKSQVSKFSRDLRKMRGEVLTNENRFLLEKVQTQKKQLETQKKQLENQNKEIETHKKQLENQGLQLKDMGQKLNELYGMLKVVETAFPDLYNGASTSAASTGAASTGTCDKQPSFGASPITDHYSPIMDH